MSFDDMMSRGEQLKISKDLAPDVDRWGAGMSRCRAQDWGLRLTSASIPRTLFGSSGELPFSAAQNGQANTDQRGCGVIIAGRFGSKETLVV